MVPWLQRPVASRGVVAVSKAVRAVRVYRVAAGEVGRLHRSFVVVNGPLTHCRHRSQEENTYSKSLIKLWAVTEIFSNRFSLNTAISFQFQLHFIRVIEQTRHISYRKEKLKNNNI